MTDLIERLESATEGSRELSDDILRAVGWDKAGGGWRNPHGQYVPFAPDPSRSIDDKLPGENVVHVKAPGWHSAKPEDRWEVACATDEPGHAVYAYAKTEVLARRAAALKARTVEGG